MMNQSTSIKEGMAAWRETITECDRCHCGQLMPHEDGLQCFNCNHIIYYGIIEEKADREETPAVENKTVSEKEPSAAIIKTTAMVI